MHKNKNFTNKAIRDYGYSTCSLFAFGPEGKENQYIAIRLMPCF
jgi:hypothetical protein